MQRNLRFFWFLVFKSGVTFLGFRFRHLGRSHLYSCCTVRCHPSHFLWRVKLGDLQVKRVVKWNDLVDVRGRSKEDVNTGCRFLNF